MSDNGHLKVYLEMCADVITDRVGGREGERETPTFCAAAELLEHNTASPRTTKDTKTIHDHFLICLRENSLKGIALSLLYRLRGGSIKSCVFCSGYFQTRMVTRVPDGGAVVKRFRVDM